MDYISLLIIGFIVGLSGAMLPGPMLVYTISKVLQGKKINALFIVLGHIFIEAVTIVLILWGLKPIISSKILYNFVLILGAAVLILMGLHIIFRASQMNLSIKNKNISFSSGLIVGGAFFTAFNPTFPTWWVSVGVSLLSRALLVGILGVIVLVLGNWLADLAWFSLVALALDSGKLWLNDRRYQLVLRILGVILVGLGLWFILQIRRQ